MTLVVSPMFPVWSVTYVPGLYLALANRPFERPGMTARRHSEGAGAGRATPLR